MKRSKLIIVTLFMAVLIVGMTGCEYDVTEPLWEKPPVTTVVVTIDSIAPAQATPGVNIITIYGENFQPDNMYVFFNNVRSEIISADTGKVKVYRPNIAGDDIIVKVACHDRINVAHYGPIKLDTVVEDFGNFFPTDAILATTLDQNENVYLAMNSKDVIKLNSDGSRDFNFLGTTDNSLWTDMKIYSDGYIYMARDKNIIFRLPKEGGSAEKYLTLAGRSDRVKSIDFDEYGNLFGGGYKSDLIVIKTDTTSKSGFYANYEINSVRIYGGCVYVAAKYAGTGSVEIPVGIWLHEIDPDGSVGNQVLVLNWSASQYAYASINDITFSQDGVIYIGTDDPHAPLMKYTNGELVPVYYDIVSSPVDKMVWGNSTYLYTIINRSTRFDRGGQFLRINTGELGAPYYGRQ